MFQTSSITAATWMRAIGLGALLCTAPLAQAVARPPEQTAHVFYQWYMAGLSTSVDPLRQTPQHMAEFVSAGLMTDLRKRTQRKGLRADYFIQAQDLQLDWASDIAVGKPRIVGKWATVLVTLGTSERTQRKLILTLAREGEEWKIRMVRLA